MISITDLEKTYGDRTLFADVSAQLNAGQRYGLVGANGSGKTTLMRLLAGLMAPTKGDILIDGVDLRQLDLAWWRRQICYLPQEPRFLNGTIAENLMTLDPEIAEDRLNDVCRRAGMMRFIEQSADGFRRELTDTGRTLSVGIRRRLALARALTGEARMVLFDEPTEGMDAEGCEAVYALLNDFAKQGRTIIVASNDPQVTKAAQMILDLNAKPAPRMLANPAVVATQEAMGDVAARRDGAGAEAS